MNKIKTLLLAPLIALSLPANAGWKEEFMKKIPGAGVPLEDADRWPWFDALIAEAKAKLAEGQTPVLACSALKQVHRDYLFQDFPEYRLIHLDGSFELIKARMDARDHEYMTSDLLRSQFAALEVPEENDQLLTLSIEKSPDELVEAATTWLESNN